MAAQFYGYTKKTEYFKWVNCMVCEISLNKVDKRKKAELNYYIIVMWKVTEILELKLKSLYYLYVDTDTQFIGIGRK